MKNECEHENQESIDTQSWIDTDNMIVRCKDCGKIRLEKPNESHDDFIVVKDWF